MLAVIVSTALKNLRRSSLFVKEKSCGTLMVFLQPSLLSETRASMISIRLTIASKVVQFILVLLLITQCRERIALPPSDPDNGGLILPKGFEALAVADSTGRARHIAVNDNGDIY